MSSIHWLEGFGASAVWHGASQAASHVKPPMLAFLLAVMVISTVAVGAYVAKEAPPIVASQIQSIAGELNEVGRGQPAAMTYRRPAVSFEHMYDARVKPFSVDHMYGRSR